MANLKVLNGDGDDAYLKATGAGTDLDPHIAEHTAVLSTADAALLEALLTEAAFSTLIGAVTETAPATDTASSGLNGRLQRIAQRLTSIIALLPTALGAGGGLKVDGSGTALPVSAASLPLPSDAATQTTLASLDTKTPALGQALAAASTPVVLTAAQLTTLTPPAAITGYATETTLAGVLTTSDFDTKAGSLTETAPATDTASSGLNGRLQRLAQRLTTLLAVFPTTIDTNSGNKSASTLRVVLATDQPALSNAQPVTPAATESHLGQVGGTTLMATGTMTRTSDTNAYTAGDGVTTATGSASAMSVSASRVSTGSGMIFGGRASKSTTGTSNASFRIWIYEGAPSAIPNDNAAFTAAVHADYQTLLGTASFDFANGIVGSDGVEVPISLDRSPMAFKIASGSSLTVIWEARAAYSPGSGEIFRLALDIIQD